MSVTEGSARKQGTLSRGNPKHSLSARWFGKPAARPPFLKKSSPGDPGRRKAISVGSRMERSTSRSRLFFAFSRTAWDGPSSCHSGDQMNHKRGRPKNRRAGCLLCKPNKMNAWKNGRGKGVLGHTGFGKIRAEYHARLDIKEV